MHFHDFILLLQSNNQQQGEGDGGFGAQLCQLQPAAAQRRAGGAQQQHGGVPDWQVRILHCHNSTEVL